MSLRLKNWQKALFATALLATCLLPAMGQARVQPLIAAGAVHDFSGRQESSFLSLPVIGAGVLFGLGRVVSLGIEGEFARLGEFVSATEIIPRDPGEPMVMKRFSTATNGRLCGLAHIRISERPSIPYLVMGAGYYRTKETGVSGVRDEFIYKGVGANAGVGWRMIPLGGGRSLNLEGRGHFAVGEARDEVGFSLYLTLNIVLVL